MIDASLPKPQVTAVEDDLAQFAACATPAAREEFLRRNPVFQERFHILRLADAAVRAAREDMQRADALAETAAWLADLVGDDFCRARAMRTAAHLLALKSRHEPALQAYNQAQSLFERLGEEVEVGVTLSSSLQPLIYLSRYDEAFERAASARAIFVHRGDRLRLARLETNLANILHRQDRFGEALQHYQRALATLEELGQHRDLAVVLMNMAVSSISLDDFPGALQAYERARAHCRNHKMPLLAAQADYNIAYLLYLRGEYTGAIELYRSTRDACESAGDGYHRALCDLDESELYLDLNLTHESAQLAQEAFSRFEALNMGYEAAKALSFLGVAAFQDGKPFRAVEFFAKARQRFVQEKNWVWPAMLDLYQGLVHLHEGRLHEAERNSQAALAFFSATPLEGRTALAELLQAALHQEKRSHAEARSACDSALQRAERLASPNLRYLAHMALGGLLEAQGEVRSARQSYRIALAAMESVPGHCLPVTKIPFLKNSCSIYDALVTTAFDTAQPQARAEIEEETFAIIEKAKSRQLADLISFRAHALPATTETRSGLVEQVKGLREELNWYYRQIDLEELKQNDFSGAHAGELRTRTREREASLLKALAELQATDKEFLSLQNAATIPLEAIRSVLPADGVVLSYYQAGDMIFACVMDRAGVQVRPLTPATRIRMVLRLLRGQFAKYRLGADYIGTFGASIQTAILQHLSNLYAELVQPIRDLLSGGRLIVMPHDFLNYLPFHALHDGTRFLADDFAISYSASASLYYLCATKHHLIEDRSLVLDLTHPERPQAALESQIAGRELPNARVCGAGETNEATLQSLAPGCRYLYWSTYARFRQDNPMFSTLQLGEKQLSLFDLYHLRLPVELILLNGAGPELQAVGEGNDVLGLTRGLFYAGARAVLMNQWNVNDPSSAELMKAFCRRLRESPALSLPTALQQAMLELRATYPSPYHWASLALWGAGSSITASG